MAAFARHNEAYLPSCHREELKIIRLDVSVL